MKWNSLSYRKVGAGDRGRTGDVQLGNLIGVCTQKTYASKALDLDHLEPPKINHLRFAYTLTQ